MRERIDRLMSGFSEAGISRWVTGLVGGVAMLLVGAVLLSSLWTARVAARETLDERVRAATGVAGLVAARTDLLLREGDTAAVRRQMIDLQGSGLVRSCKVTLSGVGVVASTDAQSIGVLTVPETWAAAAVVPDAHVEGNTSSVWVHFEVPGRGAGVVEASYDPVSPPYAAAFARAGGVALFAVCAVWLVFSRFRERLSALARVGTALVEVAGGERRAEVLRVAEDAGPFAEAWNTLLAERDLQDQLVAEHQIASAQQNAPGENAGVVGICDALTHGVVAVGHDRRISYVNGAAGVLLGRHRADLERAEFTAAFEDESVRAAVAECLDSRTPVRRSIEIARGEPGRDPDAELRLSVRSTEVGGERIAGILIEDITQQRVADRSRNSFVAQATHELRTPLTNIRLYVEQAVDEGEADPQLRAQALNVINSEARRLERIVADMLSVAEIEAGSLSIRPGDVRTDALFEDLTNDYAAQAAEKTIELGFDLPPKMPVIHGDRDRLGQALHNLVGNALKYTPPGGKVTVRVEAPEQGGLIVHVIDTGIGIDPDECERIFDRFYRANDRRIAHVTGSGLGLALAREIVRLHGGDIEVESKLDQGSTFTITLPGAEQTRQQRAA
jgi:signal transduction histidine kinase